MAKILIVAPSWIGDTVAAQPLLMRLKEYYPLHVLEVLAAPWVAPVLEAMPEVNRVIPCAFKHGEFGLGSRWRLGRSLRAEGYEAAYILPNSWKSALVPFFAGIPLRVGFLGEKRYGLLNRIHVLEPDRLPRQVQRYAQLAEPVGGTLPEPLPNPALETKAEHVARTLQELGLPASPAPIIFCPGAEYGPAKRWPERYFAQIARQLAKHKPQIWMLGSAKDAPVAEEIIKLAGGLGVNLCGKTRLDQAIDLISCAALVLTNDSGLMHVAAALGRPQVALFGSSTPDYTPPLSDLAEVATLKLACSPCFKRECPLGHFRCMNDLTPQLVYPRIRAILRHGHQAAS